MNITFLSRHHPHSLVSIKSKGQTTPFLPRASSIYLSSATYPMAQFVCSDTAAVFKFLHIDFILNSKISSNGKQWGARA